MVNNTYVKMMEALGYDIELAWFNSLKERKHP